MYLKNDTYPEGQREFPEDVKHIGLNTPDNPGVGIFWWKPATIGGRSLRNFVGNQGNFLPVITVFDKWTRK
jgi:arabinogalactan endo-1,4-beta-galactosidase